MYRLGYLGNCVGLYDKLYKAGEHTYKIDKNDDIKFW